jgi:LytS/YehU family sensor histidine kinase
LQKAKSTGARQYERDAHYLLFQLNEKLHKSDSAYAHLKLFTSLNNAIGIDMSARKLALFKTINEREQAQLKIDLLNRQKLLQEEEIKRTSNEKTFLLIGVIVITLLFIMLARNILLKKSNAEQMRQIAENELNIQKLQSKKMLSELEMQVLRSQMNPHFIFNSLNSIDRFILQNNKAAATAYLSKFSRLVRMILQNSQNELISIEQELESLKLYLELEWLRFDGRFNYSINIDKRVDLSMLKVPPLIIQPFVENAIWHGLMPKETKGKVAIELSLANDFIHVKITDDGVGRNKLQATQNHQTNSHRSMGVSITSQRIKMLYTSAVQISPVNIVDLINENGSPAGTEVNIQIPIVYD